MRAEASLESICTLEMGHTLDLQPPREHLFPGQKDPQYDETFWHQLENSKQFMLSGNPAFAKQDVVWIKQEDTALMQESLSPKAGSGLEHHFPHLYSQVWVGATV